MPRGLELQGRRFGRLTVVSLSDFRGTGHGRHWNCLCDCGTKKRVIGQLLTDGKARSCGCYRRESITKHGGRHERLYCIYSNMIQRCTNKKHRAYRFYGGRGVTICPEWRRDYANFRAWALSVGYADSLTIDRINSRGSYEPSNCQWITKSENIAKRNREWAAQRKQSA